MSRPSVVLVLLALVASCDDDAPPFQTERVERRAVSTDPAPQELPLFDPGVSRYAEDSPVRNILSRMPRGVRIARAPGFHFVWGDAEYHAEGALAMAASIPTQRLLNARTVHDQLCPGVAPCETGELLRQSTMLPFVVERRTLTPGPLRASRNAALAHCQATALTLVKDLLQGIATRTSGLAVPLYSEKGFKDAPSGRPTDAHLFGVYGLTTSGLLLRDAADRYPITYQLEWADACRALVAPLDQHFGTDSRIYSEWGVSLFEVKATPGAVAEQLPIPGPAPGPPGGFGWSGADDLPAVTLASMPGADPFDLGPLLIPTTWDTATPHRFRTRTAPRRLDVQLGIAPHRATRSRAWVKAIETAWRVRRASENAFAVLRPDGITERSPLEVAYNKAIRCDREALALIAARFEAARRAHDEDARWLAEVVSAMVQNIPYELIHESPMGFRSPVNVLEAWAGDCDSKATLAAAILDMLGVRAGVAVNERRRHAVLAVAIPAEASETTITGPNDSGWILVETTARRALGDMAGIVATPNHPESSGWVLHPLANTTGSCRSDGL